MRTAIFTAMVGALGLQACTPADDGVHAPAPPAGQQGATQQLPAGFPLAIMEGSRVQASATLGSDGEKTFLATILHGGEIAAAAGYYEEQLRAQGFTVERSERHIDGRQLVTLGGKGAGADAAVALSQGDEGVFAQISFRLAN